MFALMNEEFVIDVNFFRLQFLQFANFLLYIENNRFFRKNM